MSRPKIYVNPKFHTTNTTVHINPNFVAPRAAHVNPLFLQVSQPVPVEEPTPIPSVKPPTTPPQPLIRKTRHKLLRIKNTPGIVSPTLGGVKSETNEVTRPQMIKVGRNKLIKANIFAGMSRKAASMQSNTKPKPGYMYKVDNRVATNTRAVKTSKTIQSRHKTLELKRINGTVYKTSKNRLERQSSVPISVHLPTKHSDRLISLNGSKFILKEGGKRLIPIKTNTIEPSSSKTTLEIAGIRFVQLMDGTYVRHHSHLSVVRQHLTTSKHKSIKILTQKLRKCNIPCPVYRRLGKCLAFTRGRCPKLHDPKYVEICVGALRNGGCTKVGCLMSHDLSLSKMPACKYFLKGCCVNDHCPYLHHKLNENVPLCPEFLKGFCPEADQCGKRHEYPESKQKSTRTKRRVVFQGSPVIDKKEAKLDNLSEEAIASTSRRYFLPGPSSDSKKGEDEEKAKLAKMLKKVELMKIPSEEVGDGPGKEISDDIFAGMSEETKDPRPPIGSLPAFIPI